MVAPASRSCVGPVEREPGATLVIVGHRPARYVLLCFSEHEPGDLGPRRVTQAEIRATFGTAWTVDSFVADRFAAQLPGDGAEAWLALLTRI